mgnify:FL=1
MLLIWAIYLINIHRTVCTLLNAELILPRGDQITQGKIIRRAKDNGGRPIGRRHDDPLMNSREYEVEDARWLY